MAIRAVLFDLDDTLFDHRLCARTALSALHDAYDVFRARAFAEVEQLHSSFLEDLHPRVTSGELPLEYARQERFRRLFAAVGETPAAEVVMQAAETYRKGYSEIRQAVAGAGALLAAVKQRARVGIVSNNLLEEQQSKLRQCALDQYVDVLVVSGEIGISKPDRRIFQIALDRLDCRADETVMVGDSWSADVVGALAAGIRPVWFNPERAPAPDGPSGVAELYALEPVEDALEVIFGTGVSPTMTRPPEPVPRR